MKHQDSASAPYTLTPGAPRYWYPASPRRDAGHIGARRGKQARYSFVDGKERKWHRAVAGLGAAAEASLRGMTKP